MMDRTMPAFENGRPTSVRAYASMRSSAALLHPMLRYEY
jgi:hypothetical protein